MTEDIEPKRLGDQWYSWQMATGYDPAFGDLLKSAEEHSLVDVSLRAFPLEALPFFTEAEKSAVSALEKLATTYLNRHFFYLRNVEAVKDRPFIERHIHQERETLFYALRAGILSLHPFADIIEDAAKKNDEAFFVELADAIVNQRTKAQVKKVDPLKLHLAGLWTKHRLWLMTDYVGSLYLERRLKLPLGSADAYGKCKRRLGLKPHPKPPFTRINKGGSILGVDKFLEKLSDLK